MAQIIEVLKSLELEKRLLPRYNPEITWFYVFLPTLIGYFALLSNHLNTKPIGGQIEIVNNDKLSKIFTPSSKVELIYVGNTSTFSRNDGPIWVDQEDGLGFLLFTNTLHDKIYKWEEGKGLFSVGKTLYADHTGCYLNTTYCSTIYETGSSSILKLPPIYLDPKFPNAIDYLATQYGERAITLFKENGTRIPIVTHYRQRKFNSPNDLILTPEGHIYFTDSSYGLYDKLTRKVTSRDLPFHGIYFLNSSCLMDAIKTGIPTTGVKLVYKDMSRPHSLAFSPDFSKLYVSNADNKNAYWKILTVLDNNNLKSGDVVYNITTDIQKQLSNDNNNNNNNKQGIIETESESQSAETCTSTTCTQKETSSIPHSHQHKHHTHHRMNQYAPGGVKVDIYGHIFTTGMNYVYILTEEGELIGKIKFHETPTNLVFGGDGKLYIILTHSIARVKIKTKPVRIMSKITRK